MKKLLISIFLFLNFFLVVYSSCAIPKIIFNEDQIEGNTRVFIRRQNQLCEWTWSDPYSTLDAKDLPKDATIKLKALVEKGHGLNITRGDVGEWKLEYTISYLNPNSEVPCSDIIVRNVRILQSPDPCEVEALPCAKNGLPHSSKCSYDPSFRGCKRCECKFGCQAGPSGAEYSCVDKNMCNMFYNKCSLNSTCVDLQCPETFKCVCNKGFETVKEANFHCESEEACRSVVSTTECTNKNECLDQYICPTGSECVDTWPEQGGCNSDPYYPSSYPSFYSHIRCGYSCRCKEGWETESHNPLICKKVCTRKCPPFSRCELDSFGNDRCICESGYIFNEDLNVCDPIDPCTTQEIQYRHDCDTTKPGSECVFISAGKFHCKCPPNKRESPDSRSCIENNKCDMGLHNCMRNSKGEQARTDNFWEKGIQNLIQNSYCVPVYDSFECKCDDNFISVTDQNGELVCVEIPDELNWDLNPREKQDKTITLPHFAVNFSDPSYWVRSQMNRVTAETSLPPQLFRRPLDICGVYNVDYNLDEKANKIYDAYVQKYPSLLSHPQFKKELIMKRFRTVIIKPWDRCAENYPTSMYGFPIDIRNSKRCHVYANCKNNWSFEDRIWETARTYEACDISCKCFEGYYNNVLYRYNGDGINNCKYDCVHNIHFKEGSWVKIRNKEEYKFLGLDLSQDINVFIGPELCYVCKSYISGNSELDFSKLTDDYSSCPYPILERRQDRSLYISRVNEDEDHVKKRIIFKKEEKKIDLKDLDNEFLETILNKTMIEKVGILNGKPYVQVFIVKYSIGEGANYAEKKRIVIHPIVDLWDDIEKIRKFNNNVDKIYYTFLVLASIIAIYLLIVNFRRIYACFQYFILSNRDRNIARLAWDTIYFFRHPLNAQARNQLVYQALYMD